jgi:D-3-phosphoglycerate dehydrogenase
MTDPLEPLILDLLEWIGTGSRPYAEVMDAWRTSCPRLPVWEEANVRGLLRQLHESGDVARVALSPSGLERLDARVATRQRARA